jgi:ribosome maturation factor RimP
MKVDVKQTVSQMIEAPLRDQGYDLAEVVVSQYKSASMVRVFVYGDQGVTIDECARLSRIVGDIIDDSELFDRGYTLELSSPGLDRPLATLRDYRYRVGETIRIEFADPKRKRVKGEIVGAGDDRVELKVNDEKVTYDLAEIKLAKIVF